MTMSNMNSNMYDKGWTCLGAFTASADNLFWKQKSVTVLIFSNISRILSEKCHVLRELVVHWRYSLIDYWRHYIVGDAGRQVFDVACTLVGSTNKAGYIPE